MATDQQDACQHMTPNTFANRKDAGGFMIICEARLLL
jgi:hypothetical protein